MYLSKNSWDLVFPKIKASEEWLDLCNETLVEWNIDTPIRVSMFLAQVSHESGNFRFLKENLNYSEKGLLTVFSKYFTAGQAKEYARKPERIANRVYANRMGNGSESSGDGWKYRGRGLIQLTGFDNYSKFSKDLDISIEDTIDFLETKKGALVSACWFWKKNNLNKEADKDNIRAATRKINGGFNGLQHRTEMYKKTKIVFKVNV